MDIKPIEREIIHRVISGEDNSQISRSLNLNSNELEKILKKPIIREEIDRISDEIENKFIEDMALRKKQDPIREELQQIAIRSVDFLSKLLNEDNFRRSRINLSPKEIADLAVKTLEMAGHGKPTHSQASQQANNVVISGVDLTNLQSALTDLTKHKNSNENRNK